MPWIVLNWKHDDLIDSIPGRQVLKVTDAIPKRPGVYVTHPRPDADDEAVEDMLWRIWDRERVGVFIDEGYMLPARSPAFQAVLTQGRSKRVPVIMLTQRPTLVTRFAFSEAEYIQLFKLTDERDMKTVREFMPLDKDYVRPEPYHSHWWDNVRDQMFLLRPVPDRGTILATFRRRLGTNRKAI